MDEPKKVVVAIVAALLFCLCIQSTLKAQGNQAAAEKAIAEAEKLRAQKTAEALRNAIKKYEEALAIWRELGDKTKEASTLNDIGIIYREFGEANRAIECFNQVLILARALGNKELEAYTLLYLGQAYDILGETRRELDFYNQALEIAREIKHQELERDSLGSLGYIYFRLGEIQNALNFYNQSLPLIRAAKDKHGEVILLVNIGAIYSSLGKPQSAIDNFLLALPIIRELNNPQREAVILNNIGTGHDDLGEFQKAIDYYNQSLALRRKTGDRVGEAVSLSNIGRAYFSLNDNQKALEFFNQALPIQRELKVRRSEANTLNNIGRIYVAQRDYQKAFEYYSQSLPIRREVGDIFGESTTLHNLAFVERERGNLNEARLLIENAIQIVESVRATLASQELRASYFASSQDMYKFQIDVLMNLHAKQTDKGFDALALQASENARARSLLDILAEVRADIRQGVDSALLERERALQKQLNAKDEERRRARNAQQAQVLDKEIQRLTSVYQDLQAEIKLKSPRYAALTQPKPVGLKEIQQMLDADTLLLEYSLGSESSYLWIVSNSSIKTFVLPKRQDIETKAREFYESVKTENTSAKTQKASADLSKMIIEPVTAELGNKRLLIVPDGILQYVPFAALSNPQSAIRNPQSNEPLIISNEIVYLPSASTLAALRDEANGRKPAPKTIAVLADPVFDANDPRIKPGVTNQNTKQEPNNTAANSPLDKARRSAGFNNGLPRLPGTRREATTILSFVSESERKSAMDFQANRATVTSVELSQYRIIHFATHGFIDSQHPELSGIVFSLVDEKGKPQDGFLRLHEIFNLKLPADLIVLSACHTALGKDVRGEGLIGLTRGFMYAGALRVTASLWGVDDSATSELMKLFYQNMLGEKKLRPAAALREAQITMWKTKRWNAPFYWSAFTIQGEWR
jgi:CHAT domain-containing protein